MFVVWSLVTVVIKPGSEADFSTFAGSLGSYLDTFAQIIPPLDFWEPLNRFLRGFNDGLDQVAEQIANQPQATFDNFQKIEKLKYSKF